jgi:membrane protein YdbS with pleckstrin-like domain
MRDETPLLEARFDTKLPTYWLLSTLLGLTLTVIGIPLIPVALIFGAAFFKKRYDALECILTERTLHVRRGVIFRSEKNVPLDKIQDISLTEGPLLRHLGLASLRIETAGQSVQGGADATLVGIVDSPAFRDAILDQRDRVVGAHSSGEAQASPSPASGEGELLREIRDSLLRIEARLEERA